MAYDASQDQTQDPNQAQTNTTGAPGTPLSGGGGGFAGAQTAAGSAQDKPSSSGSWTNLNTYLNANQDQSSKMGSDVANYVGGQASQAQGDLNKSVQGFQSQAPYQTVNNTSSDQVGQALQAGQYATGGDPTQAYNYLNGNWGFSPTASDITSYQGGSGAPSWQTVGNEFNTAATSLGNTQTEAGRQNLLQSQYGQNGQRYNQGEQLFDQLLLQQDPSNQAALNGVYQQYAPQFTQRDANGNPAALSSAVQGSQAYDQAERAKGQGYQQQAQQSLMDQISGLGTNVQGEVGAKQSDWTNQYNQLSQDLSNKKLNALEAQQLGISGNQNIYNLNPSSFLGAGTNPYVGSGAGNYAASANDWGQFQGLQKLIGGMNNGADAQAKLSNVGLTGTQPTDTPSNPYGSFQSNAFKAAVADAQGKFDQSLNTIPNQDWQQNYVPETYRDLESELPDWQSYVKNPGDYSSAHNAEFVNTNEQDKYKALADFLKQQGYDNQLQVGDTNLVAPSLQGFGGVR